MQPVFNDSKHFSKHFRIKKSIPNRDVHQSVNAVTIFPAFCTCKKAKNNKFIVLSAGMNDLIRPALYPASHRTGEPDIERPPATIRGIFPVSTFPKHGGDNKDAALKRRRLFPV
ncbi:hypothetical protein DMB45_10320 [Sanguibacteroides justesenii]|nr:hypothetical protein DMB45_10320 [Sanguibacteroides justesenii]